MPNKDIIEIIAKLDKNALKTIETQIDGLGKDVSKKINKKQIETALSIKKTFDTIKKDLIEIGGLEKTDAQAVKTYLERNHKLNKQFIIEESKLRQELNKATQKAINIERQQQLNTAEIIKQKSIKREIDTILKKEKLNERINKERIKSGNESAKQLNNEYALAQKIGAERDKQYKIQKNENREIAEARRKLRIALAKEKNIQKEEKLNEAEILQYKNDKREINSILKKEEINKRINKERIASGNEYNKQLNQEYTLAKRIGAEKDKQHKAQDIAIKKELANRRKIRKQLREQKSLLQKDVDILKRKFPNNANLGNILNDIKNAKTLQQLKLVKKEFRALNKELNQSSKRESFGSRVRNVSQSVLAYDVYRFTTELIREATQATIDWGKESIKTGDSFNLYRLQLSKVAGSTKEMLTIYGELQDITLKTNFQIDDLVKSAFTLEGLGVNYTKELMVAITDVASISQRTPESVAAIVGKLRAGEPQALSRSLPTLGISPSEFRKALLEVEDLGNATAEAFTKIVEDRFGGLAELFSKTLQGMQSNLQDRIKILQDETSQSAIDIRKQSIYELDESIKNMGLSSKGILITWNEIIAQFQNIPNSILTIMAGSSGSKDTDKQAIEFAKKYKNILSIFPVEDIEEGFNFQNANPFGLIANMLNESVRYSDEFTQSLTELRKEFDNLGLNELQVKAAWEQVRQQLIQDRKQEEDEKQTLALLKQKTEELQSQLLNLDKQSIAYKRIKDELNEINAKSVKLESSTSKALMNQVEALRRASNINTLAGKVQGEEKYTGLGKDRIELIKSMNDLEIDSILNQISGSLQKLGATAEQIDIFKAEPTDHNLLNLLLELGKSGTLKDVQDTIANLLKSMDKIGTQSDTTKKIKDETQLALLRKSNHNARMNQLKEEFAKLNEFKFRHTNDIQRKIDSTKAGFSDFGVDESGNVVQLDKRVRAMNEINNLSKIHQLEQIKRAKDLHIAKSKLLDIGIKLANIDSEQYRTQKQVDLAKEAIKNKSKDEKLEPLQKQLEQAERNHQQAINKAQSEKNRLLDEEFNNREKIKDLNNSIANSELNYLEERKKKIQQIAEEQVRNSYLVQMMQTATQGIANSIVDLTFSLFENNTAREESIALLEEQLAIEQGIIPELTEQELKQRKIKQLQEDIKKLKEEGTAEHKIKKALLELGKQTLKQVLIQTIQLGIQLGIESIINKQITSRISLLKKELALRTAIAIVSGGSSVVSGIGGGIPVPFVDSVASVPDTFYNPIPTTSTNSNVINIYADVVDKDNFDRKIDSAIERINRITRVN